MDKNNKTLVIAVLIMLLALVSFNFNRGDLSGRSVDSSLKAVVYPGDQVCGNYDASKKFTLSLDPGSNNLRNKAYIVDSNRGYKAGEIVLTSNSYVAESLTKDFLVSCDQKGNYHLEFFDSNKGNILGRSNEYTIR